MKQLFSNADGTRQAKVLKAVVSRRDSKRMSWAKIGEALGMKPRMAVRIYDEAKGKGAHHGLLEGKGGRTVA